jgi:translation initiation factor 2B subunit (eIF-2B alpha/beta/delta family)
MARKASVSNKGTATATVTRDLAEENSFLLGDNDQLRETVRQQGNLLYNAGQGQLAMAKVAQHNAATAFNTQRKLDHVTQAMAESLIQEHQDLRARMMRIEQRLGVLGIKTQEGLSSFDVALSGD